jgi:hypothetical protein
MSSAEDSILDAGKVLERKSRTVRSHSLKNQNRRSGPVSVRVLMQGLREKPTFERIARSALCPAAEED